MPDELVKMFLEEVIDSISNLSDALSCILQYYCVAVEENKFIESKNYESKGGKMIWQKKAELLFHVESHI